MKRRRYATRDELTELLIEQGADRPAVERVLDGLTALGVDVAALVKITVDEDD